MDLFRDRLDTQGFMLAVCRHATGFGLVKDSTPRPTRYHRHVPSPCARPVATLEAMSTSLKNSRSKSTGNMLARECTTSCRGPQLASVATHAHSPTKSVHLHLNGRHTAPTGPYTPPEPDQRRGKHQKLENWLPRCASSTPPAQKCNLWEPSAQSAVFPHCSHVAPGWY